jgi:hypothetical protein
LAATLSGGGIAFSAPKLSTYLALGLHGQRRLVDLARQVNHTIRHKKKLKSEIAPPVAVGVRDVCREFMVEIGLIAGDMSTLPAARNAAERNAAAEEGDNQDYDEHDHGDDDGGVVRPADETGDQRSLGTSDRCIPGALGGGGDMDLDTFSDALADGALKNYCRFAMSDDETKTRIHCVHDEPDGEEMRNRVYSMPNYDSDGRPTHGPPVLVHYSGRYGAICRCAAALEAPPPRTLKVLSHRLQHVYTEKSLPTELPLSTCKPVRANHRLH